MLKLSKKHWTSGKKTWKKSSVIPEWTITVKTAKGIPRQISRGSPRGAYSKSRGEILPIHSSDVQLNVAVWKMS